MKEILVLAALVAFAPASPAAESVKVFILAGQSNMEGKVQRKLIDHQATDPGTEDLFRHLRKDGKWVVRDDVFIKFLGSAIWHLRMGRAFAKAAEGLME